MPVSQKRRNFQVMSSQAKPEVIHLKDYQVPPYLIDTVDLVFQLFEQGCRVQSRLTLRRNPQHTQVTEQLRLDGQGLTPIWVRVDGEELSGSDYQVDEESLTLQHPAETFVLETEVEIAPENNTALEGLYRSGGMFCTQCEAEGFRRITWFLDRPDVMACFNVRIEADKRQYPVLLSNGNPKEKGGLPDGRHYASWDDPYPKPCYLFALVAGGLKHIEDRHTTPSGRAVQLRIYVEPENIDKCDHAMRSLINAMIWDEKQYGREYDLDVYNIVAVNDFNMGAMENKGLNVFNSKYVLASQDTATDQDYLGIEAVVAHEYFHNWTGNRITCRDWFQLSLKEGFTVFRDQEFSSDRGSRGVKRIDDVRLLRAHQFAEDSGPMAHPIRPASFIEINNFYTVTVYEKGAEVVRMQANLLGTEQFRRATDLYFQRFDGQAVTTDDFVQCMADVSGREMHQFKHWYDYAGTPEIKVSGTYDQAAQSYTLNVSQRVPDTGEQTDKPAFHIPMAVGLLDESGRDISLGRSSMLEITQREQAFIFENIAAEPVPSLLRGFSAPVKLEYAYSDEELMFLMANDNDGFNRWDAAQSLAQRVILSMVSQHQQGESMQVPGKFVDAFAQAMLADVDQGLLAEVLTLPSESYLGDQMDTVDPDAIHSARQTLKSSLAHALGGEMHQMYQQNNVTSGYQLTTEAIGQRRLKNLLLSYLMSTEDDDSAALCLEQFNAGSNMTDVMAALMLIADSNLPQREQLLADFDEHWRQDPLVMDKWFSVQAMAHHPQVLQQIKVLMQHPAFSIVNPNKVRALIGAFAMNNPVRFHSADGAGYSFLLDRVLELDALNPQVAARMLRGLSRWQRYDEPRQLLMRDQLQRALDADASKDLFEVASRSLAG
jgi:aminopeptidase N